MKKLTAFLLAAMMLLSLCACRKETTKENVAKYVQGFLCENEWGYWEYTKDALSEKEAEIVVYSFFDDGSVIADCYQAGYINHGTSVVSHAELLGRNEGTYEIEAGKHGDSWSGQIEIDFDGKGTSYFSYDVYYDDGELGGITFTKSGYSRDEKTLYQADWSSIMEDLEENILARLELNYRSYCINWFF